MLPNGYLKRPKKKEDVEKELEILTDFS